jgi:hypothetical protein
VSKLKAYDQHQKETVPGPEAPLPSGIACTESDCPGEMMIVQPEQKHPELPLRRALCGRCGWRGWV